MTVQGLGSSLTWQTFVRQLCELGVQNSSKEIAAIINNNTGQSITPMQVAGVKAAYTKSRG